MFLYFIIFYALLLISSVIGSYNILNHLKDGMLNIVNLYKFKAL